MNVVKLLLLLSMLGSLVGCGKPVPFEKSSYVGEWEEKTMYLLITQDGSVRYKRLKGGVSTSIEGPLKGFVENNFEVGIGQWLQSLSSANRHIKTATNGRWSSMKSS